MNTWVYGFCYVHNTIECINCDPGSNFYHPHLIAEEIWLGSSVLLDVLYG